ncbi:hypothetical protein [Cellulosimicrobium marinum]|uniref:hypothetical protein n=1 Tax=Cellulosimicrobium marinum TaxID=1638992 RepID=UPI001E4450F7|nr:hypothetical protein [Cellulosimicrobium marinum]MCB7136317.1 hypothetical protein [Cellulosimicrobium marinum]
MQRPSRLLSVALASLVGAVAALALGAPVSAAEPDLSVVSWDRERPAVAPGADEAVCAVEGERLDAAGPARGSTAPVECFATAAEAFAHVHGTAVPGTAGLAATDRAGLRDAVASVNATTTGPVATATASSDSRIVGIVYRGSGYSGATTLLWGKGANGCRYGSTYGFPNLASFVQNNVISSAESFMGCWSTFYNEYGYWGDRRNCTPHCSTMGSMNDRASSIVYRPAGTLG